MELLATGAWSGAGVLGPEAFDARRSWTCSPSTVHRHGISERDPADPAMRTLPDDAIMFLSDYGHDDDFVGVCHG